MVALIIQLISGAVGGNIVGALKNLNLGPIGNSIAGIIGGGIGGQLLSMVLSSGAASSAASAAAGSGLGMSSVVSSVCGGGIGGAVVMAIVGLIKSQMSKSQMGIENLSEDVGGTSVGDSIDIVACYQCWVSGVRLTNIQNRGVNIFWSSNTVVQNNYFYKSTTADPYAIRLATTANNLIQNNIIEQVRSALVADMPDAGSVIAYNYVVNPVSNDSNMYASVWLHSSGADLQLLEGNIAQGFRGDWFHGDHNNVTNFRNYWTGWTNCGNGQCGTDTSKANYTTAIASAAFGRYHNMVDNVLGTPGVHTNYLNAGSSSMTGYIFALGNANNPPPYDPLAAPTIMRWGNWGTVTAASNGGDGTRFCGDSSDTGWSKCSGTSEVAASAAVFPGLSPKPSVGDTGIGQPNFPAPAWFSSLANNRF